MIWELSEERPLKIGTVENSLDQSTIKAQIFIAQLEVECVIKNLTRVQRNIKTKALTRKHYGIGSSEQLYKNTIALHSTAQYCAALHTTAW